MASVGCAKRERELSHTDRRAQQEEEEEEWRVELVSFDWQWQG